MISELVLAAMISVPAPATPIHTVGTWYACTTGSYVVIDDATQRAWTYLPGKTSRTELLGARVTVNRMEAPDLALNRRTGELADIGTGTGGRCWPVVAPRLGQWRPLSG